MDLLDGNSALRIEEAPPGHGPIAVATGPRIGIGYAPEPWLSHPWRFYDSGSGAVSGPILGVAGRRKATA